jgi:hypothetical protein
MPRETDEGWRTTKLHPIFFDAAMAYRECERDVREIERRYRQDLEAQSNDLNVEERQARLSRYESTRNERFAQLALELDEISQRFGAVPYNALPFAYLYPPDETKDDEDNSFVRWLHWARHQESVEATITRDATGDLTAWDDWHRTGADVRRLAHQKGPIKPFKVDLVHRDLMQLVMAYEIEPLTAEERADCFDAYCACGGPHDAEALRKMHNRLKEDLLRSQRLSAPVIPPPEG